MWGWKEVRKLKKFTASSITRHDDIIEIGDMVYLPNRIITTSRMGQVGNWLRSQKWFLEIAEQHGLRFDRQWKPRQIGDIALMLLDQEWDMSEGCFPQMEHPEPEWLLYLPKDIRAFLRSGHALAGGVDPMGIVPHFPHMGFGYIVRDCPRGQFHGYSMASEAAQVFRLHRLHQVKQLSFLHNPFAPVDTIHALTPLFDHTRYLHSLDTLAVGTLMAHNCKLSPEEFRIFTLACEVHDAGTPAGGDAIKFLDPVAFDEEASFPKFLQGPKWNDFQAKYDIDEQPLIDTIQGRGTLGKLLDLADKSSYIARDVASLMIKRNQFQDILYHPDLNNIREIVLRTPNLCQLWEVVTVIKGEVVVTDPDRLTQFLALRAYLFKNLYYNPQSRFFEYLMGKGIAKILHQKGKISTEELLTEGDHWLERKIDQVLQVPYFLTHFHELSNVRVEKFPTREAALRRAREVDQEKDKLVILDDFDHPAKSNTDKFLVKDKGKILPYSEARKAASECIDEIMRFEPSTRLYIMPLDDLRIPPKAWKKLKRLFITIRT